MTKDFLIEIGTEELPPKSLQKLVDALAQGLITGLQKAKLKHGTIKTYATPRRLAILIKDLNNKQPDQILERRGSSLQAAYDKDGKPTKAALGFAKSCNTNVEKLSKLETEKGAWLFYKQKIPGQNVTKLMPDIITQSLKTLPIPRPMRWGDGKVEFIRPVHWVVMLYGKDIIKAEILGLKTDRKTYGHRFLHPAAITLTTSLDYESKIETEGFVIADFAKRKQKIEKQIKAKAKFVITDADLLNEVTALVEWPVALIGNFPKHFLKLPQEVLISSMQKHQRCFPVCDVKHKLLPHFITISNIKSKNPKQVITGNERVINARLSDAEFFYKTDLKQSLIANLDRLKNVIFQIKLGSIFDKTSRLTKLVAYIAKQIYADTKQTIRASKLAKTDLVTEMVGEFPDLQGIMGYYYARHFKESKNVCLALKEQYLPRFAGDILPKTKEGCCLAIADRIDTIVGIFGINQAPTGDKDPFGLRRAALGILRIIIEKQLNLDLQNLIAKAIKNYAFNIDINPVLDFFFERLRSYYLDRNITPQVFNSVLARTPTKPLDFDLRIKAVTNFQKLPEAKALAIANKRVSNILKKTSAKIYDTKLNPKLLLEPEEQKLYQKIIEKEQAIKHRNYTEALAILAELKTPIDKFFDQVMVMTDDENLRNNRLRLLHQLRQLFLHIADISLLN